MSMISSQIIMYSPDDVLQKLNNSINHVKQNIQCYCSDPLRDFTRSRKWSVDTIIKFLVQLESKSMKSELCNFFLILIHFPAILLCVNRETSCFLKP